MEKLRVLIVDDAAFMRRALAQILAFDPAIQIVDSVQNGLEALQKIRSQRPDVVTLDMDMPVMDGLTAIRHIMIETPIPIVVLSSLVHDGAVIFEALRLGVVDFIPKPSGAVSLNIDTHQQKIIDRIKMAHDVNLGNLRRVRLPQNDPAQRVSDPPAQRRPLEYLIAIGTTISGPNTIIRLLSQLPSTLPAAVVVVQEISPRILPSFSEGFNQFVPWEVKAAQDGMSLDQGTCYISSNENSLTIGINNEGIFCLQVGEEVQDPLNIFFSSAAAAFGQKTVGLLLSGLGKDGADGFARIQQENGVTIVEDTRCCVYPCLVDHAVRLGVVDHVLHEKNIPRAIESLMAWA